MYGQGRVTSLEENIATITCGAKADMCKKCGSSFCAVKTKKFDAENSKNLDIAVGDMVEVFIPPAKAIGYSFFVLIFPLLMFIAGYFLSAPLFGTSTDSMKALYGTISLFIGFAIVLIYSLKQRNSTLPVITEKLNND